MMQPREKGSEEDENRGGRGMKTLVSKRTIARTRFRRENLISAPDWMRIVMQHSNVLVILQIGK